MQQHVRQSGTQAVADSCGEARCQDTTLQHQGLRSRLALSLMQSESEQRQRAAALARMQRLPEGVSAIAVPPSGAACHVCGEEDEADDNVLLQVGFSTITKAKNGYSICDREFYSALSVHWHVTLVLQL